MTSWHCCPGSPSIPTFQEILPILLDSHLCVSAEFFYQRLKKIKEIRAKIPQGMKTHLPYNKRTKLQQFYLKILIGFMWDYRIGQYLILYRSTAFVAGNLQAGWKRCGVFSCMKNARTHMWNTSQGPGHGLLAQNLSRCPVGPSTPNTSLREGKL